MTNPRAVAPAAWIRFDAMRETDSPVLVDREKRLISGFAVITEGEALGHELFIDQTFLETLVAAGSTRSRGIRSRFTHPGLSTDGLSKRLGRTGNFEQDVSDVPFAEAPDAERKLVRGDLSLAKFASTGPDGDLAKFVMDMAEEDPDGFGASIVFARDVATENQFMLDNGAELLESGRFDSEGFVSPHPANTRNLRHARLSSFRAVDVVEDPAANPGGFFSEGEELAARAEEVLRYTLCLTENKPTVVALGIDPERGRTFVQGFLRRHGLALVPASDPATPSQEETTVTDPIKATLAELKGIAPDRPAFVLEQLEKEVTLQEASTVLIATLQKEKSEQAAASLAAVEAAKTPAVTPTKPAGTTPLDFDGEPEGGTSDFHQAAKDLSKKKGITYTAAMSKLSAEDRAGYQAWQQSERASYAAGRGRFSKTQG